MVNEEDLPTKSWPDDQVRDFLWLCHRAGERFDLVQAGGGNASIRSADGRLLIKASGLPLSAVTQERGASALDNNALLALLQTLVEKRGSMSHEHLEAAANEGVQKARRSGLKPSIETLPHTVLGRYTLHTHPLAVSALVCRSDWKEIANAILPEAHLVPYVTPGYALALAICDVFPGWREPMAEQVRILLLQNHGLIVAAPEARMVMEATDTVITAISTHLGIDHSAWVLCNRVSEVVNETFSIDVCAILCQDVEIQLALKENGKHFFSAPLFPDQAVYCGASAAAMKSLQDTLALTDFMQKYGMPPKVVLVDGRVFLLGADTRKCREAEDVLKAHIMTMRALPADLKTTLDDNEVNYLLAWEAEKYRQRI